MLGGAGQRRRRVRRGLDQTGQPNRLEAEPDLVGRDPRHVEQVLNQADHLRDLTVDDVARVGGDVRRRVRLETLQREADRCQRIAQLVRERGQEFVLALVGIHQRVLGSLQFVDVGGGADPVRRLPVAVHDRRSLRVKPAILAVAPADAELPGRQPAGRSRLLPERLNARPILGMNRVAPVVEDHRIAADVLAQALIDVGEGAIRRRLPDHRRRRLCQLPEAALAGAQRLFGGGLRGHITVRLQHANRTALDRERRHARVHHDAPAVLVRMDHPPFPPSVLAQRRDDVAGGFRKLRAEQFLNAPADRFAACEPVQLFGGAVAVSDAAVVQVPDQHRVVGLVEERRLLDQLACLLLELVAGPFALGDVQRDAFHPHRAALGVVEPAADRHDVVLGSVRPDRAHLDVEHGVLCECLLRRVVDARTVGLVHRVEKSVVSHFRPGRQAEKSEAFRRPVQIAADHIPVPCAEVRAGHRQPQPLFGLHALVAFRTQRGRALIDPPFELGVQDRGPDLAMRGESDGDEQHEPDDHPDDGDQRRRSPRGAALAAALDQQAIFLGLHAADGCLCGADEAVVLVGGSRVGDLAGPLARCNSRLDKAKRVVDLRGQNIDVALLRRIVGRELPQRGHVFAQDAAAGRHLIEKALVAGQRKAARPALDVGEVADRRFQFLLDRIGMGYAIGIGFGTLRRQPVDQTHAPGEEHRHDHGQHETPAGGASDRGDGSEVGLHVVVQLPP